jgi:hypothetical protein
MTRRYRYMWFAALGAVLLIVLAYAVTTGERASLVESIIAAVLGFCYFFLKQKHEDMKLFKDLFVEFNRRYGGLHEHLLAVPEPDLNCERPVPQVIFDYFNLCGEEYLFFTEGYIHQKVWQSWCIGMLWYLEREPFRTVWVGEEEDRHSYYGLSLAEIRKGAGL